ncbi:MAG: hypothetical protein KatS3mg094_294 [Candidatus Parcubacteria bacterium]|nr:MAG: hypothetical protein KatS3mg094_294 [Candidatus Parcubacteria bacterium]
MKKELFKRLNRLKNKERNIFNRIFEIIDEKAYLKLTPKLLKNFSQAQNQTIVIIRNKILNQETHFNFWRSIRKEPRKNNELKNEYDPFCDVYNLTPEDNFGRLENKSAITASNLAKSTKNHSLVIFKKHFFNKNDIKNSFSLAIEWFSKFNSSYRIIIWNYGYRAGASIFHPHLQIFALDYLPLKINYLFEKFKEYKNKYRSDYLEDIFLLSKSLKLGKNINNLKACINLTPFKDDEIIFFNQGGIKNNLEGLTNLVYKYYFLGIENFNFFVIEYNSNILGFTVNRGEANKINSDIGALEIYAFSVVGFNPFNLANKLFNSRS